MVLIHDILRHHHHLHVAALICTLLPLHEGPAQASLVLLNQPHLNSFHIVVTVLAVLFPDHQGLVLDVTVLEVGLAERVVLRLGSCLLSEALLFELKLFALGYLGLEDGPRRLELVLGVAETDRIEAGLQKALSAHALHVTDQGLFAGEELVFAGLFTPVFPSQEFAISHLLCLLLTCVFQSKEDPLLERRLCHHLAKHFVFGLHVLGADGGDPLDKGPPLGPQGAPPHDFHDEVLLRAPILIEVAPPAEVVAQLELGLPAAHPVDHFHCADFVRVDTFAVQIELPPEEEEFLAHLMADVAVDDGVSLVVLVDDVEGLAVPDAQVEALAVDDVVAQHTLQLVDFGLQIDHDLGG